jgi:uncharacterized delta-60 repeat protein
MSQLYKIVIGENLNLEMEDQEFITPNKHRIYLLEYNSECPEIYLNIPVTELCNGTLVTIYSLVINTVYTFYTWYINGIMVDSGLTNSTFSYMPSDGDQVYCTLSGDTCGLRYSNTITFSVTQKVTPDVIINVKDITLSGSTINICEGEPLTFYCTSVVNGGLNPTYQWKSKIGGDITDIIGETSDVMIYAPIQTGEQILCQMCSDLTCVTQECVLSNILTVGTITAKVPVSVSIISSPSGTTCSGTSITYTAIGQNGGDKPGYEWFINSINIGFTNSAYTYVPSAGDIIGVQFNSSLLCTINNPGYIEVMASILPITTLLDLHISSTPIPNIVGEIIIMNSNESISLFVDETTKKCSGGNEFEESNWKWYLISGSTTYFIRSGLTWAKSTSNNNDEVYCTLTANCQCLSGNSSIESNHLTIIISGATRSVSIECDDNIICSGDTANFICTTQGFSSPSYQWKINGNNVGTNSNIFSYNSFSNNDIVTCIATDGGGSLESNSITMEVTAKVTPTIMIVTNPNYYWNETGCTGQKMHFYIDNTTNAGINPTYQWQRNYGSGWFNTGITGDNFVVLSNLNNGDIIRCQMIVNSIQCLTINPVYSNEIIVTILTPTVTITSNFNCITLNSAVTFTATSTGGGTSPIYNWYNPPKIGSQFTGITWTTTFSSETGHTVYCVMTPSGPCQNPVYSNILFLSNCSTGYTGATNFGDGFNNTVYDIEFDFNGKIYVGGAFTQYSGITNNRIIKLNQDGSKDTSFNFGNGFESSTIGIPIIYDINIERIGITDRLYCSGNYLKYNNDGNYAYLCRLLTGGTVDTSFNAGYIQIFTDNAIQGVVINSDNEKYVYGSIYKYQNTTKYGLVKINDDGTIDTSFDYDLGYGNVGFRMVPDPGDVDSVYIDGNNRLFCVGRYSSLDYTNINSICQLEENGPIYNGFPIGMSYGFFGIPSTGRIERIIKDSNDKLYCVGGFNYYYYNGVASSSMNMVRINLNGTVDKTYRFNGDRNRAITIDSNEKIYVGGDFTYYLSQSVAANRIIRINPDGTKDTIFDYGSGFNGSVQVIKIDSDGMIWVGGSFTTYKGITAKRIIKLKPNGDIYQTFNGG